MSFNKQAVAESATLWFDFGNRRLGIADCIVRRFTTTTASFYCDHCCPQPVRRLRSGYYWVRALDGLLTARLTILFIVGHRRVYIVRRTAVYARYVPGINVVFSLMGGTASAFVSDPAI